MSERSSVHKCLTVIDDLYNMLRMARKPFGAPDNAVISREDFTRKLDQLRQSLPETLATARQYVDNYTQIMQQAQQECTALRVNADQEAAQKLAEAQQVMDAASRTLQEASAKAGAEAQVIIDKANADANVIVEAARQEAQRIVNDAAAKAAQMVEQEDILRRARIAAEEVQADTQQEMTEMRHMTFDYLDRVMEHVDRFLSERLTELRRERTDLNNHR